MGIPTIKVRDNVINRTYDMQVAIYNGGAYNDISSYSYLNTSLLNFLPVYNPDVPSTTRKIQVVNDIPRYNGFTLRGMGSDLTQNFLNIISNADDENGSIETTSYMGLDIYCLPWGIPGNVDMDIVQYFCLWANNWNDETNSFNINAPDFRCGVLYRTHNTLNDEWKTTFDVFSTSASRMPKYLFAGAFAYKRYDDITGISEGSEDKDNTSDSIIQDTTTNLVGVGTLHTGKIDSTNISNLSVAFGNETTVNFLKSYFVDVFDAVMSLMVAPFDLASGTEVIETTTKLNIFGYEVSNVSYYPAMITIKRISCGVIHITPRYGNFMDYSPYSTYQIYIPYHGYVTLNADDVVDSDIELIYDVNIATGTFTAFVRCKREKNGISLNAILYQVSGNMYYSIPLSRADFRTYYANLNSSMYSLGSITLGAVGSAVSGNALGVASSALAVGNMVNNMEHSKVQLQRNGAIDTGSNLTTLRIPHVVISNANLSVSETLAAENGYYSNVSYTLSELEGFTKIKSINLSVSGCTDNERKEIEQLLKSGVII